MPSSIPKISDSAATSALLVHTLAANDRPSYCRVVVPELVS